VYNDTDINGLAAAVSGVLNAKGFGTGAVGNNEAAHVSASQVQAADIADPGAQAVAKNLGGLPVVSNKSVPVGTVRVVLANDYTGPGSGLGAGGHAELAGVSGAAGTDDGGVAEITTPSPILTAGSNDPQCVN
jgi:hypothetical protein